MREYTYDSQGRVTRENTTTVMAPDPPSETIDQYLFDERGNIVVILSDGGERGSIRFIVEYDNLDRPIRDFIYDVDGTVQQATTTTYYGDSDQLRETVGTSYGANVTRKYTYNEQGSVESFYFESASEFITYQIQDNYNYASDGVTAVSYTGFANITGIGRPPVLYRGEYDENGIDEVLYERTFTDGTLFSRETGEWSSQGVFSRRTFDFDGDGVVDQISTATSSPVACPSVDDDCDDFLCFIGQVVDFVLFCF